MIQPDCPAMKHYPLLLLLVLPSLAAAAPPDGQLSDHSPRRAWLENYDPTLVSSRFVSEFSFESFEYKVLAGFHWYF